MWRDEPGARGMHGAQQMVAITPTVVVVTPTSPRTQWDQATCSLIQTLVPTPAMAILLSSIFDHR